MKLHWSSRSPFVRKVMVAAHELGLVERLDLVRSPVAMHTPNQDLMRDNPLSRLPTLVLDDGTVLTESVLICEYLDTLDGRHRLFPADQQARFDALRRQALGSGFLEIAVLRRNERDRPPEHRSPPHLASYEAKMTATLATFERDVASFSEKALDIGHIATACALSYLDFRFADEPWRAGHPALARWHEGIAARPSMQATAPIDQ